jgi:hypothetical protein
MNLISRNFDPVLKKTWVGVVLAGRERAAEPEELKMDGVAMSECGVGARQC